MCENLDPTIPELYGNLSAGPDCSSISDDMDDALLLLASKLLFVPDAKLFGVLDFICHARTIPPIVYRQPASPHEVFSRRIRSVSAPVMHDG
jgi:hypothetical protein